MKNTIKTFIVCLFVISGIQAQDQNEKYKENVQSLDSTIETLYGVISGEKGEARDWDLFRHLFKPEAKLIPSWKNKEGQIVLRYMTAEDYVKSSGTRLEEVGFLEKELHRVVQTFGNITQIFSTYESYHSKTDEKPFARGINSIQLLNDGNRWWIINIYWTAETKDNPIPDKYLPK